MVYWATAARFARRETKLFTPIKALPSIVAAGYLAWHYGASTTGQWARISFVLCGSYALLAVMEFLWRMFLVAPRKLYTEAKAEEERLRELFFLAHPGGSPSRSLYLGRGTRIFCSRRLSSYSRSPTPRCRGCSKSTLNRCPEVGMGKRHSPGGGKPPRSSKTGALSESPTTRPVATVSGGRRTGRRCGPCNVRHFPGLTLLLPAALWAWPCGPRVNAPGPRRPTRSVFAN